MRLARTREEVAAAPSLRRSGRAAALTAGVIDSPSGKTTESGGPRGYDAGRKIEGRKRDIVAEPAGNMLGAITHPADIQDRDGAPHVIALARQSFPTPAHLFADGGRRMAPHRVHLATTSRLARA